MPGDATSRDPTRWVTAGVVVAGLAITGMLSAGAAAINDGNETRLLTQRAREAATVLTNSIATIRTPLISAADLAEATEAEPLALEAQLTALVTAGQRFVSASIWRLDGSSLRPLVVAGSPPDLATRPAEEVRAMLDRARSEPVLAVFDLTANDEPSLGYAVVSTQPDPTYVAYVERVLPPNRTAYVRDSVAFEGLDNAVYLGSRAEPSKLLTASTPDLPLTGRTRSETIPFGNSQLRLVVTAKAPMGGALAARLWWLLLLAGIAVTAALALLIDRVVRRRTEAVRLAAENRRLYAQQRDVAQTLQHSLLPRIDPVIGDLAFASLYQPASAEGVDIGGDWYDAVKVDDHRVIFAVGDVSGRGLEAATVMASVRLAIRAYASHGLEPATILSELSGVLDIERDGHFATVICGLVDTDRRQVTLASAGHPPALIVTPDGCTLARPIVGPPVGLERGAEYPSITIDFPKDSTIVAFTDGLFERRGETLATGLERVRVAGCDLDESRAPSLVIDHIRSRLGSDDTEDDTAMLGVGWT